MPLAFIIAEPRTGSTNLLKVLRGSHEVMIPLGESHVMETLHPRRIIGQHDPLTFPIVGTEEARLARLNRIIRETPPDRVTVVKLIVDQSFLGLMDFIRERSIPTVFITRSPTIEQAESYYYATPSNRWHRNPWEEPASKVVPYKPELVTRVGKAFATWKALFRNMVEAYHFQPAPVFFSNETFRPDKQKRVMELFGIPGPLPNVQAELPLTGSTPYRELIDDYPNFYAHLARAISVEPDQDRTRIL